MKTISFLLLIFALHSCNVQENQQRTTNKPESIATTTTQTDSLVADSIRTAYLKRFDLPDIKKINHEVYLFTWGRIWTPSTYFLLEKLDKKIVLRTRMVYMLNSKDTLSFSYHNKPMKISGPTLLDSCSQEVTSEDWEKFRTLLKGSYYWQFREPDYTRAMHEGEGWGLECKSTIPRRDSLTYSSVFVLAPYEGSYKTACSFLINLSKMTKGTLIPGSMGN